MAKFITISGKVTVGLGRGSYFIGQEGYRKQFVEKLGMDPYMGTLNLRLSKAEAGKLALIKKRKGILIRGFVRRGRRFGDVMCWRAEIGSIECALVAPKLSKHTDVAEIISSSMLRRSLRLGEGARVRVVVEL